MLDIDVKNGQNLALRSQFLPPIAIVLQAARLKKSYLQAASRFSECLTYEFLRNFLFFMSAI